MTKNDLPTRKVTMLQHKQYCPSCKEENKTWLLLIGNRNVCKHQCTNCFTIYINVFDANHNVIDHIIEDDNDDRTYLE